MFGDDDSLLNSLHLDSQFNEVGVDLFIVASPTIAMKPWFDDRHRILGLDHLDLDWRAISETEAHYREKVKAAAPSDPPQYRPANAVLAYRRDP